jgi:hypothetical protein
MSIYKDQKWYQQFRCRNCGEKFSKFPSLLGCVRLYGVDLMRLPHSRSPIDFSLPEYMKGQSGAAVEESRNWVHSHILHLCSEAENGIADLVGFTTVAPQVPEGGIRELTGDEVPAHLR